MSEDKNLGKPPEEQYNKHDKWLATASEANILVPKYKSDSIFADSKEVNFDGSTETVESTVGRASSINIKNRIAACREAYDHSGIIGNAIDILIDFALEGISIIHESPSINRFYNNWAIKVNLFNLVEEILKAYYRDGNVAILKLRGKIPTRTFRNLKKVISSDFFIDDNISSVKIIPYAYQVLDILRVTKSSNDVFGESDILYKMPNEDLNIIKNPKNDRQRNFVEKYKSSIGEENFKRLVKNGELAIPSNRVSFLYYKKDSYKKLANPMFWRIIPDLKYKKALRDMDISAVESVKNAITIFKLGDTPGGFPPSPDMFTKLSNILNAPTKTHNMIWSDLIGMESNYPPVDKILGKEKYEQVDGDIRAGIGISEIILNGQGTNFSNSFISVKTLLERLESGRKIIFMWLDKELRDIAKSMKFKKPPVLKFGRMSLSDEKTQKMLLLELVDRNMVSYQTCVERFGESFEIEIQRLKEEDKIRRKNEIKSPYAIAKTGKFGPMMQNGPVSLELIAAMRNVPNKNSQSPSEQEANGDFGGRPDGSSSPQEESDEPRNSPISQVKASYYDMFVNKHDIDNANEIYSKIFSVMSNSMRKLRNVKSFDDLSHKDRLTVLRAVEQMIGNFEDPEEVNMERIQELLDNPGFIKFEANITGDQEPEPTESTSIGKGVFILNPINLDLHYFVSFTGFDTLETGSHIHFGEPGKPGPILYRIGTGLNKKGKVNISEEDGQHLMDGNLFINIHSKEHPSGEIRGQIIRTMDKSDSTFLATAPPKLDRCVKEVVKKMVKEFRQKNNRAPNKKERQEMTSSAFAICNKSVNG